MVEIGGVDGVTAVPEKVSAILPGARLAPDRLCLQCDTLVAHKAELVFGVEPICAAAPRRNRSAGDRLASRVPWSGFGRSRDTHPRKADVGSGLGTAQFCRPVPVRGWQPCESHPGLSRIIPVKTFVTMRVPPLRGFRKANVIYVEDFYRNFGYPFAAQTSGGSIQGMLDAIDLFQEIADSDTTLVPGHGTLITKKDLLPYRAMLVDIMAKVKTLREQGKSLEEVLAANLTDPYDETIQGDTQRSKDRFITEVYDEVKDFPPIVNGRRAMPIHP